MAEINPQYPITELTQEQYDNLEVKYENTLYAIPYSGILPKRKNSGEGKMECVLMTQEEYDGLQVKSENLLYCIGNPEPSYDETKIAVITLDGNDEPTEEVYYTETISDAATYMSKQYKHYWVRIGSKTGITSIPGYAFANSYITKITIPSSVEEIGEYAFGNAVILKIVEMSAGVVSIGKQAFYYCTSLPSIEIPSSVSTIGYAAFQSCSNLVSVTIKSSNVTIPAYTFTNCNLLTTITIYAQEGSISGAPWGAPNATVVWTG